VTEERHTVHLQWKGGRRRRRRRRERESNIRVRFLYTVLVEEAILLISPVSASEVESK
jgi:hypothetical protein